MEGSRSKITSVVVIVFFIVVALLPLSPVTAAGGPSLTPDDIRAAYDVDPLIQAGYTGKGVTVAIVEPGIGPTFYSDVEAFSREYGLPPASISWVAPNGVEGKLTNAPHSGSGELTGDVELVHAMAPDAKILLVLSVLGEPYVIEHNAAAIVTASWGSSYSDNGDGSAALKAETFNDELAMSVSEHITLIDASGDGGTNTGFEGCTNSSPPCVYTVPAYNPWITFVGGTELEVNPYNETAWDGSGGGVSTLFPEPTWQNGVFGVPQNGRRNMPDIALAACDPGYAFYYNNSQSTTCGTSDSAPTFAGIIADIDQAAGRRVGFLNPTLYSLAASDPSVFHEITSGCTLVGTSKKGPNAKTGYCAHAGWNFVAGLGSIDAARLALYFAPSAHIVPEAPNGEPASLALTSVTAVALLVLRNRNTRFISV